MTRPIPHGPLPKFLARPWNRAARDEASRAWRDRHKAMVIAIRSTLDEAHPDLLGPSGENRMAAIQASLAALYGSEDNTEAYLVAADPKDREALMDWFGAAGVVSTQRAGGNGCAIAHIFSGWLMKLWVTNLWGDLPRPEWAQPLFDGMPALGFREEDRPRETIERDLGAFLKAHRRALGERIPTHLRSASIGWNKETLLGSQLLILLASVTPERVPRAIVDGLLCLQASYTPLLGYEDEQRQILAGWEQRVLEEFTEGIPGPPTASGRRTGPRVL